MVAVGKSKEAADGDGDNASATPAPAAGSTDPAPQGGPKAPSDGKAAGGDGKADGKKGTAETKTADESDIVTAEETPRAMCYYPTGHWSELLAAYVWPPYVKRIASGSAAGEEEDEDARLKRRSLIRKVGERRQALVEARKHNRDAAPQSLQLPNVPTDDLLWRPKFDQRPMWYRLLVRIVYAMTCFTLFVTVCCGLIVIVSMRMPPPNAVHKPLADASVFKSDTHCSRPDLTWKLVPLHCAANCDVDNKIAIVSRDRRDNVASGIDPHRCLALAPFRYIDCTTHCN